MNNSIENRVSKLEAANKPPQLGQRVHFAAVHDGQDEQNAEVMNDIAKREASGQRCILFTVIPPKPRPGLGNPEW